MIGPINVPGKIGALLYKHIKEKNPHKISKDDIGLGNVSNEAPSDQKITYTAAATVGELVSGETLGTALGKIASAISKLISHLSSTNPHNVTASQVGAAASSHNQAASTITAGTFAGQVVANSSGQAVGTSLLRNSKILSTETTPTVNGEINWQYE